MKEIKTPLVEVHGRPDQRWGRSGLDEVKWEAGARGEEGREINVK